MLFRKIKTPGIAHVAYLLGDLVLLGFVIAVYALTAWRPGRMWLLLGAGLATSALVDGYFLYEGAIGVARVIRR